MSLQDRQYVTLEKACKRASKCAKSHYAPYNVFKKNNTYKVASNSQTNLLTKIHGWEVVVRFDRLGVRIREEQQ